MGGGGRYYDRDVTSRNLRTSRGTSSVAEEEISRSYIDEAVLPKGRRLVCNSKSPLVVGFDDTGSMDVLPKIFYDKAPMIAGQIVERGYLDNPMVSLAAIGDALCDEAPIQICDFSLIRNLDEWLQRIWLEAGGGGQAKESYELTAYFYARMCDIPKAVTPIFIFLGDEGFREKILASDLKRHLGGNHENVDSRTIFNELKQKFMGNVFLIHRYYNQGGHDPEIVEQWQKALGEEKVIILGSDLAVADTMLGLLALVTGKRDLKGYLQDMKNRKQTAKRITEVRKSLEVLAATVRPIRQRGTTAKTSQKTSKTKRKIGRL